MKIIVAPGESRFEVFEKGTTAGLLISIETDEAALVASMLANMQIEVHNTLDGQKVHQITPNNFKLNHLHGIIFANNAPLSEKTFEVPKTINGTKTYILPFYFGTNEVLNKQRGLYVEIKNGNLAGSSEDATVVIETIPSVGLKTSQLTIERLTLEATKTNHTLKLGSFVNQLVYFPPADDDVFSVDELEVSSDKLNEEYSARQIYNQLNNTIEPDIAYAKTPINLIKEEIGLNGVSIDIDFLSAKASRELFIVRRIVTPQIANELVTKTNEHSSENIQFIKATTLKSACGCN